MHFLVKERARFRAVSTTQRFLPEDSGRHVGRLLWSQYPRLEMRQTTPQTTVTPPTGNAHQLCGGGVRSSILNARQPPSFRAGFGVIGIKRNFAEVEQFFVTCFSDTPITVELHTAVAEGTLAIDVLHRGIGNER